MTTPLADTLREIAKDISKLPLSKIDAGIITDAAVQLDRLTAIETAARSVRQAQKAYFKYRTDDCLTESKQLEKHLDDLLAGKSNQTELPTS